MQVEVIKHKDVRGKELLYLKISNSRGEALLNIGQKTYDAIKYLQDGEPDKDKNLKVDNKK